MATNPFNIIVCLCDGHGMLTTGKETPHIKSLGRKVKENEFNRAVVKHLDEILTRCGFRTLLVAPTDEDTPLATRVKLANNQIKNKYNKKADLYISIHYNAYDGKFDGDAKDPSGFSVHIYPKSKMSRPFAEILIKHLAAGTAQKNRGIVEQDLAITRDTLMPAILSENGFMDNEREALLMLNPAFQMEVAVEHAKAVCEYYGVKYISSPVANTPSSLPDLTFTKVRVGTTDVYYKKIKHTDIADAKFVYKKGAKVSEITRDSGADIGINFPYFYNGIPLGDTEDNDIIISSAYGKMLKWHEFAFVDGKPVIGQLNKKDNQDFLVQGAPLLIENGKLAYEFYRKHEEVQDDVGLSSAQRTFVGVTKNSELIIAIADGRTSTSKGLMLKEMAEFMLSKGAWWALNGDGGGSSTLAVKKGTGGVEVVNQNRGSNERVDHHALLFYLIKEEPKKQEVPKQEAKKMTEFKDVPAGAWYEGDVKVTSDLGIMGGYEDGTFKPANNVTRAEMAAIISKLHSKGMIK